MTTTVKLDTRELDRIASGLKTNVQDVLRSLAFDVEGEAKQMAAVDTGAMRASIYVVTQDTNGYESAAAAARSANPEAGIDPLPLPSGKVYAHVGPSVEYAGYVELGTSRAAAQPFLVPAVERVAQKMNSGETWRELFE